MVASFEQAVWSQVLSKQCGRRCSTYSLVVALDRPSSRLHRLSLTDQSSYNHKHLATSSQVGWSRKSENLWSCHRHIPGVCSLRVSVTLCSHADSLSLCASLRISLRVSGTVCLIVCLPHCVSHHVSHCVSASLCVSLRVSLRVSGTVCLIACLPHYASHCVSQG